MNNNGLNNEPEQGHRPEVAAADNGNVVVGATKSFNRFATQKTIGQSALNLALLVSDVKKFISVLNRENKDGVYRVLVVALGISIGLQLIVGVLMGIVGSLDLDHSRAASILNNVITGILSAISVINIAVISVVDDM